MKTIQHRVLCTAILIAALSGVKAQDLHFSQFNEAPLLRNPALAGIFSGDLRIQAVYRTQWQSVTVPYQTTSLNGEFKLPVGRGEDFLTIGGQILHDRAGSIAMTSTHVLPAVNYHKSLSEERNMYLSLGFMGGVVQRRFDRSKVTTNSQFDGNNYNPGLSDGENFDRTSYSFFDGTVGMSFNSQLNDNVDNNFFVGVAYHHFSKPSNIAFYSNTRAEMTPKWVYSGGLRLATSDQSYVTVHADLTKQGSYTETIGGAIYTHKLDDISNPKYLIHAGGFMRLNDAFIPVAKIEMRPLSISVSYDVNMSKLSSATRGRGGFEMALAYQVYLDRDNTSRNAVRCPRF